MCILRACSAPRGQKVAWEHPGLHMVGSHQVAVGKQIRFSARTASSLNGQAVSQPHPRPFFETGSAFVALAVPNLNGWTRLASNPLSVWTFPVQGLKTRVTMISSQFFKVTFIYLHECVCVRARACTRTRTLEWAPMYMWRSENNLQKYILSLHHFWFIGFWIQIPWLISKLLYKRSHCIRML